MDKIITIPPHMEIAFSQLGVKEWAGDPSNPQVEDYLRAVDLPSDDKIPWCAAWLNWVLLKAGLKGTGSGLARSFLHWSQPIAEPEFGCVVVLRRGIDPRKGHVGFFINEYTGFILLLGGNQADQVGVNPYSKLRVISYRKVFYQQ